LLSGIDIHALAHITGGGIPENLPRCLGAGQSIQIIPDSWDVLPIFTWLATQGNVNKFEMFNTFNMGIGMVVIVPPSQRDETLAWFIARDIPAYHIGTVIEGKGAIEGL
jgi:phosphoribosylformylglycinamidine cyclo-ligase